MDYISILDINLELTRSFPDVDLELILLAWNPRGYHRVSDRVFDRLRNKYGVLENNNRVLEFVGDKILGMITLTRILDLYGLTLKPHQYHEIHQSFVTNENLTRITEDLGICSEIYPGEILVRDGDWHNPCSNSMEAILAALYTQYSDLSRISEWFFSISGIRDNFQNHVVRSLGLPNPPSPEFPENLESEVNPESLEPEVNPEPFESEVNPESLEPEVPPESLESPEIPSEPLIVRMAFVDLSGIIHTHKFCPILIKSSVIELVPRGLTLETEEQTMPKKYPPSKAYDLFSRKWKSGYTKERGYFSKGLIPYYSELYKSPGTGWYGYYYSFISNSQTFLVLLSDATPTKEEFEISKEYLAMQAIIECKITGPEWNEKRYMIEETHVQFNDIQFRLRMFIVPVGDSRDSLPSLLEYDLQTKKYTIGTVQDVKSILSRWDLSFLDAEPSSFQEYLTKILAFPGREFKLFFGRFNLYSKIIRSPPYGFGVRYIDQHRIGEIPLSYVTIEEKYREYMEFLGVQMFKYLVELGLYDTDLTEISIYAPRDPGKYEHFENNLPYPVGTPFDPKPFTT